MIWSKDKEQDEVAFVQQVDGETSSKASLYSHGGDEKQDAEEPDLPDEVDEGSAWLDSFKTEDHGTSIVMRSTGQVVYTFARAKRWTRPEMTMYHGEASSREQEQQDLIPFACITTGWSGNIHLKYQPDPESAPIDMRRKDFLKQRKWWAMPERFEVDGVQYRIRIPSLSCMGRTILTVADEKAPLCIIRPVKNPFNDARNSIEILPRSLSSSSNPTANALLLDNQPTKLLDLTLAADHIYRQYMNQVVGASFATVPGSTAVIVS